MSSNVTSLGSEGLYRAQLPRWGLWWAAGLGVLFALLHRNFLYRMFFIAAEAPTGRWGEALRQVLTLKVSGDWSHALVVPAISAYFIYKNRQRLAALPSRVCWPGLALVFLGLFSFAWWIYPGRNDMFQGYSMILGLFGLVLFLQGPAKMRVLWFPILYLALGVKISDRLWEQIAWQLQLIAANAATIVMQVLGYDASVEGSTIKLTFMRDGRWVSEALNVAEACSGLRMLMAFVALGAAIAYLVDRPWWHRLVMLVLTVPIAVAVNVGRVSTLGVLFMMNRELARGDFHVFIGMLMLLPAAGLFLLVGWVLDHLVTHEPDDPPAGPPSPSPAMPLAQSAEREFPGRRWVLRGLLFGGGLTALIGLQFGLLLAILRPDAVLGGRLGGTLVWAVSALALVGLGAGGWFLWRSVVGERTASTQGLARGVPIGVALGVLIVATLGLNGVVQATRVVLIKQPVPMREPLWPLPKQLGNWAMVREDPRLSREELEALGTEQYLSRIYRDLSMPENAPGSILRLHVAYYTGTPDTVPHVPDRCFVAGGLVPIGVSSTTLHVSGSRYRNENGQWLAASRLNPAGVRVPQTDIDTTVFTFASPEDRAFQSNVIYFFAANGKFLPTPERVRLQGFDPRDRYSYYCKIEVGVFGVGDHQAANDRVSAFLADMLPEIMACLPDWIEVTEGRWPPPQARRSS
jgi:exosortase